MAHRDVREYIAALEKCGEAKRIEKEIDWNLEAGAITRLACERHLPAPYFQKIKGYSSEYSILGAPLSNHRRLAVAMDLDPDSSMDVLLETYRERVRKRIPPVIVNSGPCKENIMLGDDINLFKFPAPLVHEGDGGRYLFSWHTSITRDPDTGWVNWGMYRGMIHNKNSFSGLIERHQHIGYHFHQKYKPRRQSMQFAYVIGADPVTAFVSCTKNPRDVDEAEIAGGLRQQPVELVKCETNDLYVPANAEIVVEGEVSPTETVWEGPFGEFSGYRASPRDRRPLFRVKAITHRNNPILTMSCMGTPLDDSDITSCFSASANLPEQLKAMKVPGIVDVWAPPELCHFAVVVSVKSIYAGMAQRAATAIWSTEEAANIPYVVVVQDDVNPRNLSEVMHSIVTKCHPWRGIQRIERAMGHTLTPFLDRFERLNQLGSKVFFDCTWPTEWDASIAVPTKASFNDIYPEEVKRQVLENLKDYYG